MKIINIITLPENYNAVLVAQKFVDVSYCHYGLPKKVISYCDSVFMGNFWGTLFKSICVKYLHLRHITTDWWANWNCESKYRRKFEHLPIIIKVPGIIEFEVVYNSGIHSTTLHTPLYLNYVIHPRIIPAQFIPKTLSPSVIEFLDNIQNMTKRSHSNISNKNETMAKQANKKLLPQEFQLSQMFWLSTKKSENLW